MLSLRSALVYRILGTSPEKQNLFFPHWQAIALTKHPSAPALFQSVIDLLIDEREQGEKGL